jgi:hypothetical protein
LDGWRLILSGKGNSKAYLLSLWFGWARMTPPCFVSHLSHPDPLSLTTCVLPALQYTTKRWGHHFESLLSCPAWTGNASLSFPLHPPPHCLYFILLHWKKSLLKLLPCEAPCCDTLKCFAMFVAVKDLRFCVETGKLWEPSHLSSGDSSTQSSRKTACSFMPSLQIFLHVNVISEYHVMKASRCDPCYTLGHNPLTHALTAFKWFQPWFSGMQLTGAHAAPFSE